MEVEEDAAALQKDTDLMMMWAEKWGMVFNVEKCKVMQVGRQNRKHQYRMGDVRLAEVAEAKDLGVWIGNDLKPANQCKRAAKLANSALGLITRCFHYRTKSILVPLYKTFVRPKLEFAVTVWNPWLEKDEEVLEKVQRRFVKMLSDAKGDTYEERLRSAGLITLKQQRLRGDMIETFKTMRGVNRVDRDEWFSIQTEEQHRPTRSNAVVVGEEVERRREIIIGERANLEVRRNFFHVRVEEIWNKLPEAVKAQRTVNGFKSQYDRWREENLQPTEAEDRQRTQLEIQELP